MNPNPPPPEHDPVDEALDRALRGWVEARSAPEGRPEGRPDDAAIAAAIERRLREPALQEPATPAASGGLAVRRVAAGLAVAASLAVAVWLGAPRGEPNIADNRPNDNRPNENHPPDHRAENRLAGSLRLDDQSRLEDQSRQRRLVRGVYDLFGDQLTWLAVAPDGLRMGIEAAGAIAETDGPPPSRSAENRWREFTALRLVVMRRPTPDAAWEIAHELDVLAPPDRLVSIAATGAPNGGPPGNDAVGLSVWSFPLPGGGVAVDLAGELPGIGPFASGASHALLPGEPQLVANATVDGVEYRLMQTAAVVATDPGADPPPAPGSGPSPGPGGAA